MMSYRLSYPLYLDVSDHNKHNAFHMNGITGYQSESNTNRNNAIINLNAFYENMLANGHNRPNVPSFAMSSNEYYNSSNSITKKLFSENESSRSSFSIDAILGINNLQHNNYQSSQDCNRYDLNGIKYRPEYTSHDMKANNFPKAKSIASVSPDSTAKELNSLTNNERKNKSLSVQLKAHKRCIDLDVNSKDKLEDRLLRDDCGLQTKSKRVRTIFTPEQLDKLETQFEKQQYMVGPERLYLASTLNLSEAQVKVWFQNRRIKWRKQHQEKEQALVKKQCITQCDQLIHIDSIHDIDTNSQFCQSPTSLDVIH